MNLVLRPVFHELADEEKPALFVVKFSTLPEDGLEKPKHVGAFLHNHSLTGHTKWGAPTASKSLILASSLILV